MSRTSQRLGWVCWCMHSSASFCRHSSCIDSVTELSACGVLILAFVGYFGLLDSGIRPSIVKYTAGFVNSPTSLGIKSKVIRSESSFAASVVRMKNKVFVCGSREKKVCCCNEKMSY
jgi:hypothetical protein